MEIQIPKLDAALQTKASIEGLLREFKVGQVLKAVAQSTTSQGLVQLTIGRQTLHARSPLPLPPGTQLTLQVEQTGEQPGFRVLDPLPPAMIKAEALRQALPRMLELVPALGRALEAGANPKAAEALPEDVRQLAQTLARLIPTAASALSGRGLQNAVSQSGLFTEAQMAKGEVPVSDVKVALARLATRLRAAPAATAETGAQTPAKGEPAGGQARQPALGLPAQAASQTPARTKAQTALPTAEAKAQTTPSAAQAGAANKTASPAPAQGARPTTATQTSGTAAPEGRAASASAVAAKGGNTAAAAKGETAAPGTRQPNTTPQGGEAKPGLNNPPRTSMADGSTPRLQNPAPPATGPFSRLGGTAQQAAGPLPQGTLPQQTLAGGKVVYPQMPNLPPMARGATAQAPQPPLQEMPAARLVQELANQVEGALSRIQYNQLSSLPGEDPNRQAWQLDLPFRNGEHLDAFRLRVEEEKHAKALEHQGTTWRVDLSFDIDPLGPVQVRLGLQGETVSSVFWAEKVETVNLIERRIKELEQGFERVGLEVGRLSAHRGRAPVRPENTEGPPEPGLVDEKA